MASSVAGDNEAIVAAGEEPLKKGPCAAYQGKCHGCSMVLKNETPVVDDGKRTINKA